jgi:prephenate dehydratase
MPGIKIKRSIIDEVPKLRDFFFELIIMFMKEEKVKIRVAIQGVAGSFHDIAAAEYFKETEIVIVPCDTFEELFEKLISGGAEYGTVAIENSVAGSILPNYELLRRSHLPVTGEIYQRIEQNLIALPGQKLSDISEIHSHPMAIQQCSIFLNRIRKRGVKVVETVDTALSARFIREEKRLGTGAIASSRAAQIYNLDILEKEIESDRQNFTRFLIISGERSMNRHNSLYGDIIDKAIICFSLPHKVGSLSQVLSVMAFYQISLTKIQSLPIIGKPWEYQFHTDLVFNDFNRYRMALNAIRPLTEHLEILGEYKQGLIPVNNQESEVIISTSTQ